MILKKKLLQKNFVRLTRVALIINFLFAGLYFHVYTQKSVQAISIQPAPSNTLSTKEIVKTGKKVKDYFSERFAKKESNLWQEFSQKTGIVKSKVLDLKNKIARKNIRTAPKGQRSPQVSRKSRKIIEEVLQDFGVNPKDINIGFSKNGICPAFASDTTIWVNEFEFSTYSELAQKFLIAHETAHLTNQDVSLEQAFWNFMPQTSQNKSLMNKYIKFQEARADIIALTKHADYAQGGVEFFTKLMNQYGNGRGITHPCNDQRLNIAKTILELLQLETNTIGVA